MIVKTKKLFPNNKVHRLKTGGNLQEIMIKEDIENPEKARVHLFFRGHDSSGIIDLKREEAEKIFAEINSKLKTIGKVKILK